tara:strand:+ start:722 stop:892 length:171 start_codon:yes stop_codon:yes gene_type:complete
MGQAGFRTRIGAEETSSHGDPPPVPVEVHLVNDIIYHNVKLAEPLARSLARRIGLP